MEDHKTHMIFLESKAVYLTTTEVVEKAISFAATQMIYSYSTTGTTYFLAGDGRAGRH